MLRFAAHPAWYRRLGLALLLFTLSLYVAAFPPFHAGTWVQTEPLVLVFFILAALAAGWMLLGLKSDRLVYFPAHPLWPALLAWTGWQIIVTFGMAEFPFRSWFGPPQTGDGAGLAVATLLTVMLACPLWRIKTCRDVITAAALGNLLVQCVLHFFHPPIDGNIYLPERLAPAQWPQYLPFMGGYLWIVLAAGGYLNTGARRALCLAALAALLILSHNRSAMALFAPAMLAIAFQSRMPAPNRRWRMLLSALCFLPLSLVAVSPLLPGLEKERDPAGTLALLTRINEGIGARMALNQVALAALTNEPGRWLAGQGWGGFTDDLFKYALVDGVHVYRDRQHAPNWFLINGNSHHSHNQPVEALLALGLPGMALWYALPLLMLWRLPQAHFWPCAPMIVALAGLGHFWFQLPQCFPYQALSLAALMTLGSSKGKGTAKEWKTAIIFAAIPVMSASAWIHYGAMMHGHRVHDAITARAHKDYNAAWLAEDLKFGGDRWAQAARFYARDAAARAAEGRADDNMRGWYRYFLDTARQAAQDPRIGARASSLELQLQYALFGGFDTPLFSDLRLQEAKMFEEAVMRLARKAPLRDDYTSAFLLNLPAYTNGDQERQERILARMLAIVPRHRGALWLLGRHWLAIPEKEAQGREMARQAIRMGAEKVYPISTEEREYFQ